MRTTLLLLGLSASTTLSRPISSSEPDNEPTPVLFLPPGALKHQTVNRVSPQPSKGLIIPLLDSSPTGTIHQQDSPIILTSILTAQATQTIHVVAATKTVTVKVPHSSVPSPPAPEANNNKDKPFMATYFPDWTGDEFPPEKVDFNRFAWIDFAFAVPDENRQLTFTSDNSEELLKRLVAAAHTRGSKVKLSVGGWTGSADWEYPGVQGAGNNKVSPLDSAHFLSFLQLLRSQLPESAKITAATQVTPFFGPDGKPLGDVSEFAKVFDWILIMNYDVWGASTTPGPNAPLRDDCHNSTQPDASASASIAAWTKAGLKPSQITLGLPSYGYVQTSSARRLIQRGKGAREGRLRTRQDDEDYNAAGVGSVRVKGEGEGDDGGQVQFKQLISEGAIKLSDSGNYIGAGGFDRMWDVCSSTPYLVSKNAQQVVTYDDPQSLGMKAAFARGAGLRGVNMFDVHGDKDWILTDAIRAGLGLD